MTLFGLGATFLLATSLAGRVAVTAEGCAGLDATEVERILTLELITVAERWDGSVPLELSLQCEGGRIQLRADDPITGKQLSRDVGLELLVKERERTIALLAAQLFLTSWAEYLLPDRTPGVLPPPPPEVRVETERRVREAIRAPAIEADVALVAGPRLRAWSSPIAGIHGGVRPALVFGRHLGIFLELGYERGAATRAIGSVGYVLASGSVGALWRSGRWGALGFEAGVAGGAAYVDFTGEPSVISALGSSISGAVGEARAMFGPTVALGRARAGLELTFGATFPRAVARVPGADPVRIDGPFAGAALTIALGGEEP